MESIIGLNPVIEVLQNKDKEIEKIELYKGLKDEKVQLIKQLASQRNIKIYLTDKKRENSQGVEAIVIEHDYYVEIGEFFEKLARSDKAIVLVLDGIQDPRNFGALIRSAEIFGVKGIIIPERNAVKINETVIKTSTGAIEYVDIVKVTNIADVLEKLKKLGFWIYGAEGDGEKYYYEESYPKFTALVMGSEGFGIRKRVKDTCDVLVKIPMHGKINSLNVSVAGGIILSEISKSVN
ncbi:MAG: 23S rRNA (guanosine(2251)-2'-O)-methyltransferase RlmB [Fusobacteriaceae bacterium]|nr:23S rRNA (guanosine(2251)-2'-O)-methyltransferase RlmB [Fusobacteriaceae bacterium]MBP6323031.1 23S rRNA (guanosine(2251)-2'-O)-methyltransferase RlmB [Fusobacteriaceae bacterium]MBP9509971.1 23S rRNA (guanosine(2251)-2'-O)-methyltransferase RlmB [Fusobacteriaceae bacterium]